MIDPFYPFIQLLFYFLLIMYYEFQNLHYLLFFFIIHIVLIIIFTSSNFLLFLNFINELHVLSIYEDLIFGIFRFYFVYLDLKSNL